MQIPPKFRNKFSVGNGGKVLIISNIEKTDAGLYTCHVVYPVGEGESSGKLIISGPPEPVC